jgi:hypothetical protein
MNEKSDLVHTGRSVGSFMCFSELGVKGFGMSSEFRRCGHKEP